MDLYSAVELSSQTGITLSDVIVIAIIGIK